MKVPPFERRHRDSFFLHSLFERLRYAAFLYLCSMEEELTTEMHKGILGVEESELDIDITAAYSYMCKTGSFEQAHNRYPSVTKELFEINIVRVLGYDKSDAKELLSRLSSMLAV